MRGKIRASRPKSGQSADYAAAIRMYSLKVAIPFLFRQFLESEVDSFRFTDNGALGPMTLFIL